MTVLRVLIARPTLLLLSLVCIVAGIEAAYGHFVALSDGDESMALELEDDIALILVAFGVLLEERELVTEKIFHIEESPEETWLDGISLVCGAAILVIGLVMEVIDQLHDTIVAFSPALHGFAVGLTLFLHIAALFALARYSLSLILGFRRSED